MNELEAIEWGRRPRRLFDDAVEKFVVEHFPTLTRQSARRYLTSLKNLGRQWGGCYLDQITPATMLAFEQARREEGASAPTIRRDLACLSSLMAHMVDCDWIENNPVPPHLRRRRKRGLRENPPRTRYLSHEEEARLLSVPAPHYLLEAISFAIDTGLREQEQFSLTWEQVRLDTGHLEIRGQNSKNHKPRQVPLLPRAAQFLTQKPRHIRSPYVFCHPDGRRYGRLTRGFKAACRRAGLEDVRWHDLRRTCGCRLLQDHGLSMVEVKAWLGHSSVVVTERSYAFLDMENLRDRLQTVTKPAPEPRITSQK